MKIIKSILLVVSVFLAQQSFAHPFYYDVGVLNLKIEQSSEARITSYTVGSATFVTNIPKTDFSATNKVIVIGVGVDINDSFSAEVRYGKSLSDSDYSGTNHVPSKVKVRNFFSSSLVGKAQLSDAFEIFGKIGVASIDEVTTYTELSVFGAAGSTTEYDRFDLSYGVGAKYKFSDTSAVRFEYDSYHDTKLGGATIEASGFGVFYESDF